jgi:hypothetical protein
MGMLLLMLFVGCVIWWTAKKIMTAWGVEEPIFTTVLVILVLIGVFVYILPIVRRLV